MLPAGLTRELAKLAATPEIPESEAIGSQSTAGQATVVQALIPVIALISLLSGSVYLFGADASSGANQLALCAGAVVAALIGWRNGQRWQQIEESIISGVTIALKPILILFSVGLLIGSRIMSGTVPTMIYYSLQILDPAIFYAAACLICSLISLSIGSSWTVAGTIGIALIGAAARQFHHQPDHAVASRRVAGHGYQETATNSDDSCRRHEFDADDSLANPVCHGVRSGGGWRHSDLTPDSMEHLWCIHERNFGRRHARLLALLFL